MMLCSTLFWAGKTFAPTLNVRTHDGETVNIQAYLQEAFLKMTDKLVDSVGDLPGVLGFEVRCCHGMVISSAAWGSRVLSRTSPVRVSPRPEKRGGGGRRSLS